MLVVPTLQSTTCALRTRLCRCCTAPSLRESPLSSVGLDLVSLLSKNLSMLLPLTASLRPQWCALPSRPAEVTSTLFSQPPSSLDAGDTLPWSTLSCTGSDQALVPSHLFRSGLTLKKLSQ